MGSTGPLSGMDDGRVAELLRHFPTKMHYAGFAAAVAAVLAEAAAGVRVSAVAVAAFAYFAASVLLGEALLREGERRGVRVERLGTAENEVGRDGDGGDGDSGRG